MLIRQFVHFFFWSFINTYFDLWFIFQISTRQWLSVYSSEPIHKHGLSDSSGIKQQWDWWHSRRCFWWLYITILLVSYTIYNATKNCIYYFDCFFFFYWLVYLLFFKFKHCQNVYQSLHVLKPLFFCMPTFKKNVSEAFTFT